MFKHHATLLLRNRHENSDVLHDVYEAGVDVEVVEQKQFGIEGARSLRERASGKPVSNEFRRFIIVCDEMTVEAQNALLKLFEDPPEHAQFLLVMPREDTLLPTLRSRLFRVDGEAEKSKQNRDASAFLRASVSERLTLINERFKNREANEDWIRNIFLGVESEMGKRHNTPEQLRDVLEIGAYRTRRGASQKMLLEHLALTL